MTPGWTIRSATHVDAPLLTRLHAEGFAHYWDTSAFNDFFAVIGTVALIIEDAEKPLGMMVYRVLADQADIITLVVKVEDRKKGVAAFLLRHALNAAKEEGAQDMFLDVEDGNLAALALYERFGFTQINRRKLYYRQKNGSYTDALVMTRKL